MAYTVVISGVSVQCDTAEEAIELVKLQGGSDSGATKTIDANPASNNSRWTSQRVRDFFALIKGHQRKLIDGLLDNPDGMTDDQLLQLLGLENTMELSGVTTGLYKNASKVGADPKELYTKSPVTIGDKKMNEFVITPSFRRVASTVKGKKD